MFTQCFLNDFQEFPRNPFHSWVLTIKPKSLLEIQASPHPLRSQQVGPGGRAVRFLEEIRKTDRQAGWTWGQSGGTELGEQLVTKLTGQRREGHAFFYRQASSFPVGRLREGVRAALGRDQRGVVDARCSYLTPSFQGPGSEPSSR